MRAEPRNRFLPILMSSWMVCATTSGAETEAYGLFDFLGDMVEVEGELVDPMLFELDESEDAADTLESDDVLDVETQAAPEAVEVG